MKVVDPGHIYYLNTLDGVEGQHVCLFFVKREGANYPGNVGYHSGTTVQEVLRACCNRLRYVNNQIPSEDTENALGCLRDAIQHLEVRAARRHGRNFTMTLDEAEFGTTCKKCNHVGCEGECH